MIGPSIAGVNIHGWKEIITHDSNIQTHRRSVSQTYEQSLLNTNEQTTNTQTQVSTSTNRHTRTSVNSNEHTNIQTHELLLNNSHKFLLMYLNGSIRMIPHLYINISDVRDVAHCHIFAGK